jgi:small-conductance mechanosensitive channel/CRP-like cAMP-binding protein
MQEFRMSFASIDEWMIWGIALLVALPVLVVALGELADDLAKSADYRIYVKPLMITRNGVLPFAFAAILLRKIAGYSGDNIATKIVDTVLWIIVLNAALAFMNILLFDAKASAAGRARIPRLLLDIMRFIFVVCGAAVTISTIWGVNLGSLVTALGVGSVVIGLALQDTLGSLFSGIALVSARDFRVGDWVRFGTEEGPVLSQNWRSVTIKTRNGDALVVPNGVIARNPLTVLTAGAGSTTIGVDLRFPYQYSPDVISAMLTEAALKTTGFLLDPAPVARVAAFEDHAIRYGMGVKVVDPQKLFAVRSEYLSTVWYLAQRRGIVMVGQHNVNYAIPSTSVPAVTIGAEDLKRRLITVPAFSYAHADLTPLLTNARFERYRNAQTLVERGVAADSVFILLSGTVRAVQAADKGDDVVLHTFEPGQFMLSKATMRSAGSPFSLRAANEIEVIAVPVNDFKAFCGADIGIAQEMEQILSAREEVAHRAVAKAQPDHGTNGTGDRAQLLRDLFRP